MFKNYPFWKLCTSQKTPSICFAMNLTIKVFERHCRTRSCRCVFATLHHPLSHVESIRRELKYSTEKTWIRVNKEWRFLPCCRHFFISLAYLKCVSWEERKPEYYVLVLLVFYACAKGIYSFLVFASNNKNEEKDVRQQHTFFVLFV